MHLAITSGIIAALLCTTDCMALDPKRPASLPVLDFSCYTSHIVAFTMLDTTGNDLGIGSADYGKPVYRFITVDGSMLKVVEFPEFESMRKEYSKTISELSFNSTKGTDIFGWSDNEAMGLRIFIINRHDRLVSLLEVPPGSEKIPFGTFRVLKCSDAAETSPPWLERIKEFSPILDRALWRSSKAEFPNRLPLRAAGSTSPRNSSSRGIALKATSLNGERELWR
jgi:hypothetical protein